MKKYLYGICVLAAVLVLAGTNVYGKEPAGDQDRFQLFNAEYRSTFVQQSKTTGFDEKKLFLINRKTGETWMLIDVVVKGTNRTYWKKISASED
jgi:hypothetical protein